MAERQGGNMPKIHKRNLELIKDVIHKYGPLSRSEIAEQLSLTPPTITTTVASLIEQGVVVEQGTYPQDTEHKVLGRRRVRVTINPAAQIYLGIELGPYRTVLCATDLSGQLLCYDEKSALIGSYQEILQDMAIWVKHFFKKNILDSSRCFGIGMGIPGTVNSGSGHIRSCPYHKWDDQPLAQDFQNLLGIPTYIGNNVCARAIGAELYRAKELHTVDVLAYFFVSVGVACPITIKSKDVSGYITGAGEVGHMIMDEKGSICHTCGNRGCLESFAGEAAILERCKVMIQSGRQTILAERMSGGKALSIEDVIEACEQEDVVAKEVLDKAIAYLGQTLANIINFITPQMAIVDGFIFQSQKIRNLFCHIVNKNLLAVSSDEVSLIFADYDPLGGAKSAAVMAINEFFIKEKIVCTPNN